MDAKPLADMIENIGLRVHTLEQLFENVESRNIVALIKDTNF